MESGKVSVDDIEAAGNAGAQETATADGLKTLDKGDTNNNEITNTENLEEKEDANGEHIQEEHIEEHIEGGHEIIQGEQTETTVGEVVEGDEILSEHLGGEVVASEQTKSEFTEGEQTEGEQTEGDDEEKVAGEGEDLMTGEHTAEDEKKEETPYEEVVEEEAYVEEPPPDPTAPYNFSDSQEVLKEPFELRPDQIAEVEQLWELYQNFNPAYTDLDGYITEKELIYMLKCLLLMTYTPEQLQELITFCVRPPHPLGHITYQQFLRMVTVRQRDFPVEEELRSALLVLDPEKSGAIDREYLREVLSKMGHKMPQRVLDHLIKEVDISNDGTIGIEDVVGTMCIDLNRDDIIMLRQTLYPEERPQVDDNEDDMD